MGFSVENKPNSIIKFTFTEPFSSADMTKVLGYLTVVLDTKIPFAFYADSRKANRPPLNAAAILLNWMKINKYRFKELLICSAVIFGNSTTNNLVTKLLEGVFYIQPTVSPNLLTNDIDKGEKWINDQVDKFNKNKK